MTHDLRLSEFERAQNVVLKHARGHAGFDMNEPQRDEPTSISILPFSLMSNAERITFETPKTSLGLWPEVGSRMMQRIVECGLGADGWVIVQEGRYRYSATVDRGMTIRMIFSEYLACEVIWD